MIPLCYFDGGQRWSVKSNNDGRVPNMGHLLCITTPALGTLTLGLKLSVETKYLQVEL